MTIFCLHRFRCCFLSKICFYQNIMILCFFPQQNINQSVTGIRDEKLSVMVKLHDGKGAGGG